MLLDLLTSVVEKVKVDCLTTTNLLLTLNLIP